EAADRAEDERRAWKAEHDARRQADTQRQEADRRRREAETRRQEAESERQHTQLLSAGLTLDQGIKLCEEGKTGPGLLRMARALELLPRGAAADDLAFTIRANLSAWRRQVCPVRLGPPLGAAIPAIAFSPDGKLLLAGSLDNQGKKLGPKLVLLEAAT